MVNIDGWKNICENDLDTLPFWCNGSNAIACVGAYTNDTKLQCSPNTTNFSSQADANIGSCGWKGVFYILGGGNFNDDFVCLRKIDNCGTNAIQSYYLTEGATYLNQNNSVRCKKCESGYLNINRTRILADNVIEKSCLKAIDNCGATSYQNYSANCNSEGPCIDANVTELTCTACQQTSGVSDDGDKFLLSNNGKTCWPKYDNKCATYENVNGKCTACNTTMGTLGAGADAYNCVTIDGCKTYNATGNSCNTCYGIGEDDGTGYTGGYNKGITGTIHSLCHRNIEGCETMAPDGTCAKCSAPNPMGDDTTKKGYTFYDSSKNVCIQIANCDENNDDANVIRECKPNKCKTNFIWDSINKICYESASTSSTCTIKCSDLPIFCGGDTSSDKCASCKNGYTPNSNRLGCYQMDGCTETGHVVDTPSTCTQCNTSLNWELVGTQCNLRSVLGCADYGMISGVEQCVKCCVKANDPENASRCGADFGSLVNNYCKKIPYCIEHELEGGYCKTCDENAGYILSLNKKSCIYGRLYDVNCAVFDTDGFCANCIDGYFLNPLINSCSKMILSDKSRPLSQSTLASLISINSLTDLVAYNAIDVMLDTLDYGAYIDTKSITVNLMSNNFQQLIYKTGNFNITPINGKISSNVAIFTIAGGGISNYETGSHISTTTLNTLMGLAIKNTFKIKGFTTALYGEYGTNRYETFANDNNNGRGDAIAKGIGLLLHYKYFPNFSFMDSSNKTTYLYNDMSIHYGKISNSFSTDTPIQIYQGVNTPIDAKFDVDTYYLGGHIGQGYVIQLNDEKDSKIDLSIKWLYNTLKKYTAKLYDNNTNHHNINEYDLVFDNNYSSRIRLDMKYKSNLFYGVDNTNTSIKRNKYPSSNFTMGYSLGLGYAYEMAGDGNLTINGLDAPVSSLKGSTYILNTGLNFKMDDVKINLDVEGYYGLKTGYSGAFGFIYNFGDTTPKKTPEIKITDRKTFEEVKGGDVRGDIEMVVEKEGKM